jgi:hypothetical protein
MILTGPQHSQIAAAYECAARGETLPLQARSILPRRPVGFECSRKSAPRNRKGSRSHQNAGTIPRFVDRLELSKELLAVHNIDASHGVNSATKSSPLVAEMQSESDRIELGLRWYRAKRRMPAK